MAAFLSFLMPGLGQIYVGRFVRCLVLMLVSGTTGSLGMLGLLPTSFSPTARTVCLVMLAASIVIWIFSIYDARRLARRTPADYRLKDYNRWYVYALLISMMIPVAVASAISMRGMIIKAYRLTGDSVAMEPTLHASERLMANRIVYQSGPVERGDIVALTDPNDRSRSNVRRVVGLPGDRIEVRGGLVILNGRPIDEPAAAGPGAETDGGQTFLETVSDRQYTVIGATGQPGGAASLPETTVPNGHCFVLGDNRANTNDSRTFGPVPLADIEGRIDWVYWPRWASLNP
jgi:signal peptidase I